jgi:hypothetical protein
MLFRQFLFAKKPALAPGPVLADVSLFQCISVMRLLDSGSEERLLLVSPDSSVSLVVSYAEIAFYLEEAYQLLHSA